MEKQELISLLKTDVAKFNDLRGGKADPMDLSGADLRGANLQKAFLTRVDLSGAQLQNADLREANIGGTNLSGANLAGADLTSANMHRTNFRGASLAGAKIGGFAGEGRICINASHFDGVAWDKEALQEILDILNMNKSWRIKCEFEKKS
ncbi:MAG: pentapeptide repeat-containing protein [Chloroflexi bacterium]|nr:pentapeptide repeat-containing protein [Chloroflexota bacterium]